MSKLLVQVVLAFLLLCSTPLMAKKLIKIGVGNFPPFFVEKETKGIFIEITNAIFNQLPEYEVQYLFMSNSRLIHEINSGTRIDAACNIFPDSKVNAHLSVPIFRYTDVAISKKSSHLTINTISDLQGKSIAAYQGAKELLGEKFKEMAMKNPEYSEHPHPRTTTYLMMSDSIEVRVGDINIFWHDLNNKHYKNINVSQFNIHKLWPDVYSHIAFKDPILKNAVDNIIAKLNKTGKLQEIYTKHQLQ